MCSPCILSLACTLPSVHLTLWHCHPYISLLELICSDCKDCYVHRYEFKTLYISLSTMLQYFNYLTIYLTRVIQEAKELVSRDTPDLMKNLAAEMKLEIMKNPVSKESLQDCKLCVYWCYNYEVCKCGYNKYKNLSLKCREMWEWQCQISQKLF